MRAKRISSGEQFRLIMECRQSGLSVYQWCQANDINPGTFYNWISRLRKRGMVIPCSAAITEPTAELQEVVRVDLIPSHEFIPRRPIPNNCPVHDPAVMPQKDPAVEMRQVGILQNHENQKFLYINDTILKFLKVCVIVALEAVLC